MSGAEETAPSREREDSKSYRSGSRERGSGSRRGSRSPERRSETTNPNNGIGSSVNSSNNNNIPAKFVSVPATDKEKRSSNSNADASIKRVVVKRNVASPRSQSPARAASPRAQSPARINGVANKSLIAVGETNLILKKTIHHVSTMLKRLFLQTRVMYSILIHLNGQCISEGGSKKSAENGFMTGGGCNSSSSRGIMSPELDVKFDYHYLPDSRSKLWSRSCNAALEKNQCWVDKVKQSLLLDVPTLENILICAHPNKVKQSLLLDVPTPKCHGEEGSSGQHA
ncbi:hypothetical protein YC2023_009086 [Brassica napus]